MAAVVVPIISTFDSKGVTKALNDFKKLQGAGERSAFALLNGNKAVNSFAKTVGKLGAIGAGTAGVIGGTLARAAYESQKVMRQTEAIVQATGGAANMTAQQVSKLAQQMSYKTGIDDEAIQSSMNLLLTFKQVRNEVGAGNDIFNRASQAALDLGNVFGSADGAAKALGKALSDPIKGVTALRKQGINFTESQKEQIKTLVESGKTLEAQKLILAEVESQVGGTAAATATGFDKMRVAVDNVAEDLGALLIPYIERFSQFVINNVVPVMSQFASIVGKEGLGAGITFLTGSIVNGISQMGIFGKVILGVTTAIIALKTATVVYQGTMTALNVVTTLTSGALKGLITTIGAAKLAMATAGVITGIITAAAVAYQIYAGQKAKAEKVTRDLTTAVLAEKSAQSGLLAELYKSSKEARAFIDTQNALGLSVDDVAQFIKTGTGDAAKYAKAWKLADEQANGIQPTLIKFREYLGLSSDTSLVYVANIRNMVKQLIEIKDKQDDYNDVLALTNKLTGTTTTTTTTTTDAFGDLTTVVETAAEKFAKAKTAVESLVSTQRQLRDATKSVTDAQGKLQTAVNGVAVAQARLNQIARGYGASSQEAKDAQDELTKAQREAERAGYAVETANFAVTDAQNALTEARKEGDPTAIRQAEIDLANAKLDVKDAEDALTAATRAVTTAQTNLNEVINGASTSSATYQTALKDLTDAQSEYTTAVDNVRTAKERELEVTRTLIKAEMALREARGKLTAKQKAALQKQLADLKVPVTVDIPTATTPTTSADMGLPSLNFSGIDFSGITPFATGGIVTKPTLGLVGEAGPEAVIPLSSRTPIGGNTINIHVNGGDPNAVVDALRRYMRQNGSVPIRVSTP